jgi:tRNA U54 and U55 pseudouridine synthase Pus10
VIRFQLLWGRLCETVRQAQTERERERERQFELCQECCGVLERMEQASEDFLNKNWWGGRG